MGFPRCPNPSCRLRGVRERRTAEEITPAEARRYRSYRCRCGRIFWTVENVFCEDAETDSLAARYAVDTDSDQVEAVHG